ncbi:F-box protein SKIP14 [Linum perenne]
MALNCSHWMAAFPPCSSEDNRASRPMRISGSSCFADRCLDHGIDRCESQDKDILDLLPSDPFDMDITTTVTALRGWLEDYFIWNKEALRYGSSSNAAGQFGYRYECGEMIEKEDLINAFGLDPGKEELSISQDADEISVVDCYDADGDEGNGFPSVEDDPCFRSSVYFDQHCNGYELGKKNMEKEDPLSILGTNDADGTEGDKFHSVLDFALGYLSLRELLSVGMVCSSLHSAVRDDPSLWRSIYIHEPLNKKITDEVLIQLTDRARGNLQQLTLVECKITDAGLKHVLWNNPKLTKLGVAGCSGVNIDSIVTILKELKLSGKITLKHLRVGGISPVKPDDYEALKSVLDEDDATTIEQRKTREPCYFTRETQYTVCDDDRALDIEACPKCRCHKLVYDCPVKSCREWKHSDQACRACILCIRRCDECGCCINNSEYVETFLLEWLCVSCGRIG